MNAPPCAMLNWMLDTWLALLWFRRRRQHLDETAAWSLRGPCATRLCRRRRRRRRRRRHPSSRHVYVRVAHPCHGAQLL